MSATEEQVKRIQEKLQRILKQYSHLQKENARIAHELEQARELVGSHQQNIETLKQQVNVLRLGAGEMNESDKKEFERKINIYLKEIDRCIAMLGQ